MGGFKKNTDTAFVVVSCDKYSDLWEPFFQCLTKYWPDCPFDKYLISNYEGINYKDVKVLKIGEDKAYSDNILKALEALDYEWIILWLDDVFLSHPVSTNRLIKILETAKESEAGYLKLAADMPMSYQSDPSIEIGVLPKGIKYRSAIGCALYNYNTLSKLLTPNSSAWELDRSDLSDQLEEKFFAYTPATAKSPPIRYKHLLIKGQWLIGATSFLLREGFVELVRKRRVQSIFAFVYLNLYQARLFFFRVLRIYWTK
jgi:hypothetical protein